MSCSWNIVEIVLFVILGLITAIAISHKICVQYLYVKLTKVLAQYTGQYSVI